LTASITTRTLLRPWIGTAHPEYPRRASQFIVRRDPRDISVVYFYDPQALQYLRVPYPRHIAALAQHLGAAEDPSAGFRMKSGGAWTSIFDAWDRMRALEQQAERTTKTMRREQQRRRLHASREDPLPATPAPQDAPRSFGRLERPTTSDLHGN
jgi:putative transposase